MATATKEESRRRSREACELCEANIDAISSEWREATKPAMDRMEKELRLAGSDWRKCLEIKERHCKVINPVGMPFLERIHAAKAERDAVLKSIRVERGWH